MYDIIQGVLYFIIICLICYISKYILYFIISTTIFTDSRVSTGSYVANRASDKIAQLHDHIWCCRSGSAADTQALTDYVRHYLAQLAVETGRPPEVKVAAHLMRRLCYENKDNLMAGVIVGGWDPVNGGSVYNIPDRKEDEPWFYATTESYSDRASQSYTLMKDKMHIRTKGETKGQQSYEGKISRDYGY